MFVQNIGYLIRLDHIVGVAIGAQTGQDTAVNHFHRRRTAAGIAIFRLRVVNDHRIRFLDEVHLMSIDVDTVTEQGLWPENLPIIQAVDDAFAVFFQAVVQIFNPFGHVDVITHAVGLCSAAKFIVSSLRVN